MKLSDFDYFLPEELIAQHPLEQRDSSRMLVLDKKSGNIEHKSFSDLIDYLSPNDVVVINNTKVIPARLYGVKENTGAKIEVVLLRQSEEVDCWEALVKPGKKLKAGTNIIFGEGKLIGEVLKTTDIGGRIIKFKYQGIFNEILNELGQMPLPPYITERLEEQGRYQTVYAEHSGSAAAPTAGLHFTPEVLEKLKNKNIEVVEILLHVGLGTFRPVKVENIEEHNMHPEYFKVSEEAADKLNRAMKQNKRIIAVGTTSTRTLEAVGKTGEVIPGEGWTDIFIYPGYSFKIVSGLVTNFHLPKSTLIMLVSTLAGRENVLKAYHEAVEKKYRFFSFGDAMLII
ncbi:S-adenosylmethionine--tRNA ribosyltransferase-isomerase [Desulfonispora thiosulfatigenes DSM 11270]|uniref:S-adenosylmethionine:tRNA ribosyltransferase-isomerase n=1 Tax=Desulfonispora thiosulfatigenes DSM 11270 TaxID=656914 RepID=A0A1W1VS57_DESTI|nr:tRNA preQ1(34) S-adenosylmethionine ribosyltransferase-isomerase QueA [Desulfonispora thiosulfatigenes]SMB95724.1 S-adenosylmethionine--tRNA ribosyltransferase-isomerase [Desulfonispora thiosulfatigenes DSM 11270]